MNPTAALLLTSLLPTVAFADVSWVSKQLDDKFYSEGGAIADINKDGKADVISGPFWYAGPDLKKRHEIFEPVSVDPHTYSDVFLQFAPDINGDGYPDVLVYSWPGKGAWWLENPKSGAARWVKHHIMDVVDAESPTFADLTGDGKPEIVCAQNGSYGYASAPADPTQPWPFKAITPPDKSVFKYIHGQGIGDVDGDGKPDFIEKRGWWKNPGKEGEWTLNPVPFPGNGGAQMYCHDFNGDGKNDIITVIDAHAYGLSWFEQTADGWKQHPILTDKPETSAGGVVVAQMHGVEFLDVDGDGIKDVITGKRFWAHAPKADGSGGDPGVNDPALLFWLKVTREGGVVKFTPKTIHPDSGVGVMLPTGDVNGDGFPDFLTANKKGTFVHVQKRKP
ncbi:MAG: VCBS repeat-containing protein [Verrucomicrobiota bacterium]